MSSLLAAGRSPEVVVVLTGDRCDWSLHTGPPTLGSGPTGAKGRSRRE